MKSVIIFILSYVSLTLALPYRRNYDWFWNKDFKDNSEHDNDESREFFRTSTKNHDEATRRSTPTSSRPTIAVEPEYSTTDKPTTESIDTSSEQRYPTTKVHETTVDRIKAYYQERKKQALTCKENEHIKSRLDEYGNTDCQLCTCDGEGMLMCTRISCSDNGSDTKKQHEVILSKTGSNNLILREYATGCKPGTIVTAGKLCSCFCVLPSVMSCPKNCLYTDHEDSHDSDTTEDDKTKIEITTENDEAKFEITTEGNKAEYIMNTEDEKAKIEITSGYYEAETEITTEYEEAKYVMDNVDNKVKIGINSKVDEANIERITENYEANVAITTEDEKPNMR